MNRISYITQKRRLIDEAFELENLLSLFEKLGGKSAFLLRVLGSYNSHPIFFIADSNPKFHDACSRKMLKAAQILEDTGFEQSTIEAAMLCASIHAACVGLKKELSGNPVQTRSYYWVGALLPYLTITSEAPRWRWLEDWINYVEQRKVLRCNSLRVSVPKGTAFLKRKIIGEQSKQRKIIRKALLLGVQAGAVHLYSGPTNTEPIVSIAQQIQSVLQRMHVGELHPRHYKLVKNIFIDKAPTIANDNTPEKLLNGLISSTVSRPNVRKATAAETKYYRTALSQWPGLEPGLKAEILKSGIKI